MGWFNRKKKEEPQDKPSSYFTTDVYSNIAAGIERFKGINLEQPRMPGAAMDSSIDGSVPSFKGGYIYGVPEAQAGWYASQLFIGYNMCAVIAKHWLVDKACNMPARDAIRQGYNIDCDDKDISKILKRYDKKMRINSAMREYIHFGRVFGGRMALMVVDSSDPEYYEMPFNIDGVGKGSYRGISQIDPQWVTPDLIYDNVQDPSSLGFYDPTFYMIGGRRYHKSHLVKYVPYPVPDVLKPMYNYFGVSVPERIYERVYAAERTANEAPQLAMTKRLLAAAIPGLDSANKDVINENMQYFAAIRDNYGFLISDGETNISQHDTSLADLDAVIMSQYQLVAAGAEVIATKLLETTPKGFNSTGEYEDASYREKLESIQLNDLDELLHRHHELSLRNEGISGDDFGVTWQPLDSPTAKEWSEIELNKAQTDKIYVDMQTFDGEDIYNKVMQDKESSYFGLERGKWDDGAGYGENLTDEEKAGEVGYPAQSSNEGGAASIPVGSKSEISG